jgi:sugar phosphate isomerase/epimerase
MHHSRRQFIQHSTRAVAGIGLASALPGFVQAATQTPKPFTFDISLAEFSFASELFTGKMSNMDFPARAANEFGIRALEFVSGFFNNKHTDKAYLAELLKRCQDLGVTNHLIMVDGENIATLDATRRKKAVEAHHAWVDAAKYLGCSAIRVNLGDAMAMMSGKGEEGTREEVAKAALDGYSALCAYAEKLGINVIVENHFGYSTDPDWLVGIMKQVPQANKGFLPDFGNFCAERSKPAGSDLKSLLSTTCLREHDKYEGVKKMMPFTRGISAKTHKFDEAGNATDTDFIRMFKIIRDGGWSGGFVGIEYEGGLMRDMGGDTSYPSNKDGILATKKLLERIQAEIK